MKKNNRHVYKKGRQSLKIVLSVDQSIRVKQVFRSRQAWVWYLLSSSVHRRKNVQGWHFLAGPSWAKSLSLGLFFLTFAAVLCQCHHGGNQAHFLPSNLVFSSASHLPASSLTCKPVYLDPCSLRGFANTTSHLNMIISVSSFTCKENYLPVTHLAVHSF